MELHHLLMSLRERWRSGLIAALIVGLAVAGLTAVQTPVYRATNQVFVQVRPGAGVGDLNSGASFASQQIASYAELATTPFVLDQVIDELGLETTAEAHTRDIDVSVEEGSFLMGISASFADPVMAADIANSTAEHLQGAIDSLGSDTTANAVELRVVAEAVVPVEPSSPDVMRNALLGFVLALFAGVTTAIVRSVLNTRVRTVADLQGPAGRIVLGAIPTSRGSEDAARVVVQNPYSVASEAYRELRTNLQFVKLADDRRSILVTSSLPAEGKSTVTVNLARVLAMSGARVLLVDADLRSPSVHRILGLEGSAGLTTVLIGQAGLEEVTQYAGTDGLDVITSGAVPPNPSELLSSTAMNKMLEGASDRYDIVLVDAPPLLAVTDAAALSQSVGGVLVVAQSERVRRAEFERALAKLEAVDANVVGFVLNRVRGGTGSPYVYSSPEARAVLADEAESDEEAPRADRSDRRAVSRRGAKGGTGAVDTAVGGPHGGTREAPSSAGDVSAVSPRHRAAGRRAASEEQSGRAPAWELEKLGSRRADH